MSSYGSSHSGYLHPSQYPPNPHQQQQTPQPPYPTTPGATPSSQPQAFYPPTQHHQQQQAMYSSSPQQQFYSTSPTSQYQQPFYSTSPTAQMPTAPIDNHTRTRRSSSLSQNQRPHFLNQSAPIPIAVSQRPPIYARSRNGSHGSHHSSHVHDPHAYADGEEKYGDLDEDTLRSYERRYAKDRKLEKRPTLGGSLMSMARALGGKRD